MITPSIIARYSDGESGTVLASELRMSFQSFYGHLHKLGVTVRPRYTRKYQVNHSAFADINEVKAYWAGFIAADGCISDKHSIISIDLADCDIEHLEKFRSSCGVGNPVHHSGTRNSASIHLSSRQIVSDLSKLNITSRKSLTLQWPSDLPSDMTSHFIRGYFDGDGSTWASTPQPGSPQMTVGFVGSVPFLTGLKQHLITACDLGNPKILKAAGAARVQWSGNLQTRRIISYIYSNSTVWLNRKRTKIDAELIRTTKGGA